MRPTRTAVMTGAVVVCVLMLTACGSPIGMRAEPRPDAIPVAQLTCGEQLSETPAELAVPGAVPEGFVPVAVHRCDPYATEEDADGTWGGGRIERLEGDLDPVLAALAEPDEPAWPGPCTADMVLAPELWLEGADGAFVRVPYPATGCGKPRMDAVDAALDELDVVSVRFDRERLIESRRATDAGCPTSASALVVATELEGTVAGTGPVGGGRPSRSPM